jgi:hypothetical protein
MPVVPSPRASWLAICRALRRTPPELAELLAPAPQQASASEAALGPADRYRDILATEPP